MVDEGRAKGKVRDNNLRRRQLLLLQDQRSPQPIRYRTPMQIRPHLLRRQSIPMPNATSPGAPMALGFPTFNWNRPKPTPRPRKDRVMQWLPPFGKDDAKLVYETPNRIASLQYSENGKMLFLTQTVDGQQQISAIDLADPKTIKVINRFAGRGGNAPARPPAADPANPIGSEPLDSEDADSNAIEQQRGGRGGRGGAGGGGPGGAPTLMLKSNRGQVQVVRISTAGDVYLSGSDRPEAGAAAPAPVAGATTLAKPYIDKVSIKTGKKERIFEGKGATLETIEAVDGDDIKLVFTTRQKKDQVPNSYVTELQSGKVTKLTNNVDPAPWASQLKVEKIQVTRVDGIKFWVKVTTPPKSTGKLPALFWIYPRRICRSSRLQHRDGPDQCRQRPIRSAWASLDVYSDPGWLCPGRTGCAHHWPGRPHERQLRAGLAQ